MLFYAPRWLWKSWEGGKIRALMMDLDVGVCTEIEKKTKKKLILDYLWENLRYHNWWAYRYYLCEGLALVNVIGEDSATREIALSLVSLLEHNFCADRKITKSTFNTISISFNRTLIVDFDLRPSLGSRLKPGCISLLADSLIVEVMTNLTVLYNIRHF